MVFVAEPISATPGCRCSIPWLCRRFTAGLQDLQPFTLTFSSTDDLDRPINLLSCMSLGAPASCHRPERSPRESIKTPHIKAPPPSTGVSLKCQPNLAIPIYFPELVTYKYTAAAASKLTGGLRQRVKLTTDFTSALVSMHLNWAGKTIKAPCNIMQSITTTSPTTASEITGVLHQHLTDSQQNLNI